MAAFEESQSASAARFDDADVAHCYAQRPPYTPALFDRLLHQVEGRDRALDLGCGPGKVAITLASHFKQVIALDPALAMIEAGRAAAAEGRFDNIVWVNRSAEDEPFDTQFDLITAGTSIHLLRHERLFPKLAQSTRTLAVISGDAPEEPPCGRQAWTDFLSRWLSRVGRTYDPQTFVADATSFERWMDIAGRETFPSTVFQSVEDFITCQHSRATWTRASMGSVLASAFDDELNALLRPCATDGLLELHLVSNLVWGAPRATPH